jgi:hypothetical protein
MCGTPYKDYCFGRRVQTADGVNPMQPHYFRFVRSNGEYLEGFFDYRVRNEQEAIVAAISLDWGKRWIFTGEAPGGSTSTARRIRPTRTITTSSSPASAPPMARTSNAGDNGLGHRFVMTVDDVQRIYHLNRANGHIDSDPSSCTR